MSAPLVPNVYSPEWFENFHATISDVRTKVEGEFITRMCPLESYPNVLDVCCGMGRHSRFLAHRGYTVIGVERDHEAVLRARELSSTATYVEADVLRYSPDAVVDAVIVMSQSFGYFDSTTNIWLLSAFRD